MRALVQKKSPCCLRLGLPLRHLPNGFSFIELMFAVVILGVGLIMLVAIFPVAIAQTQATVDETTAVRIATNATSYISAQLSSTTATTGGAILPLELASFLSGPNGDRIDKSDARYAWTALYKRDTGSNFVQIYIFVMRSRIRSRYISTDDLVAYDMLGVYPPALDARSVDVTVQKGLSGEDLLQFTQTPAENPLVNCATPDAFVLIADSGATGESAGRVYRLGVLKDAGNRIWTLQPGYDLKDASENMPTPTHAFLIGKSYLNSAQPQDGFDGPAQEIGLFRKTIQLD